MQKCQTRYKKLGANSKIGKYFEKYKEELRVFEKLPIGVYLLEPDAFTYQFVNAAFLEIFGKTKKDFLGRSILDLMAFMEPDEFEKLTFVVSKALEIMNRLDAEERKAAVFKVTYRIKKADGNIQLCLQTNHLLTRRGIDAPIDMGYLIPLPEIQPLHEVTGVLQTGDKKWILTKDTKGSPGLDKLTRRESEVLSLVSAGHLTREIAAILNVSLQTVKIHRRNILRKLNVSNSLQAIRIYEKGK